jgi:hypothetical protein
VRDYAKVAPQFWTGTTGKALKKAGPEAVIVAMYLMTSPHANMIGVYHCPVGYIVIDTGLTIEGASKGLASAIEAGFCTFDEDSDYVFVHEFAAYQIGDELKADDKRCAGVKNELDKVPKNQCWRGFRARYAVPFHLPVPVAPASPIEAPSEPLRCQEQEQEQEQEKEQDQKKAPPRKRGVFVQPEWIPDATWEAYLKTRTKKRADNNEHALGLIVEDLEGFKARGFDALNILKTSIKSGWTGVFEPKPTGRNAPPDAAAARAASTAGGARLLGFNTKETFDA